MKAVDELKYGRPIEIKGMAYAPISELGVVYLFGRLAPKLGFEVEYIHPHFPDCIARQHGKLRRIEFELWASDFGNHGHSPKHADVVICWENDWDDRPPAYKHLQIISLKPYVRAEPRIHVVGCGEANASETNSRKIEWSVSGHTQVGDLVLMYHGDPVSAIKDAWEVVGPFNRYGRRNKHRRKAGLQAYIRRVTRFKRPLTYELLKRDRRTKYLKVVARCFRGRMDITLDWPLIYDLLVELNPRSKKDLKSYVIE